MSEVCLTAAFAIRAGRAHIYFLLYGGQYTHQSCRQKDEQMQFIAGATRIVCSGRFQRRVPHCGGRQTGDARKNLLVSRYLWLPCRYRTHPLCLSLVAYHHFDFPIAAVTIWRDTQMPLGAAPRDDICCPDVAHEQRVAAAVSETYLATAGIGGLLIECGCCTHNNLQIECVLCTWMRSVYRPR